MAAPPPPRTTSTSLKTVEWMWKSNSDPFSDQSAQWNHYSDVENMIIEKAYSNNLPRAMLDNYYIDFDDKLQVSNEDSYKQRPVKRVVRKREDKHLRKERFMDLPVGSGRSFGGQYGWVSPFIVEVRRDLGLEPEKLPSKKPDLIPILVKKAALGIVKEGKDIGKQKEAEEIASILLEKKHKGLEEVWRCCAHLYSLESFLYKTLNAAMRLVGSKDDEQVWRSKVRTLGPFCLLLWDDPVNKKVKCDIELYRGATLRPEQIDTYKEMVKKNQYGSFQSFSSCSRNRSKAEEVGNVLFIMKVLFAFIADLSEVSEYPYEEEELLTPGVCFRVESVEFDQKKNKHLIYLELRQRFNATNHKEVKSNSNQNNEADAYDDRARRRHGRLGRFGLLGLVGLHDRYFGDDRDRYLDDLRLRALFDDLRGDDLLDFFLRGERRRRDGFDLYDRDGNYEKK